MTLFSYRTPRKALRYRYRNGCTEKLYKTLELIGTRKRFRIKYHCVRQNMNVSDYLRRYYICYSAVYFYRDYSVQFISSEKRIKKLKNVGPLFIGVSYRLRSLKSVNTRGYCQINPNKRRGGEKRKNENIIRNS